MQLGNYYPTADREDWVTLILGIYVISESDEQQPEYLLACYNKSRGNYSYGSNPSHRGVRTKGLQKAKMYGFYENDQCCIFKPELVYYCIERLNNNKTAVVISAPSLPIKDPLQQIYYGAPGTGKSHATNDVTSKYPDTVRTTFHPDSDYSTFVGAYKPVMEEADVRVVPVVLNNGASFDQNNGTLKEKRISYKFVKQAFLKAYVKAWINFAKTSSRVSNEPITFSTKSGDYKITSITDNKITVCKTEYIEKEVVKSKWEKAWEGGEFNAIIINHGIAKAVCQWIFENTNEASQNSFEDGWEYFFEQIKNGLKNYKPFSQTYSFELDNDKIKVTSKQKSYKDTIRESFEQDSQGETTAEGAARKLKEYNLTDFDNAWKQLSNTASNQIECTPQFLVIEEINRGNCAQIFGDLFQLLDRKNGFSEYPIEADDDIRKALQEEKPDDSLSFAGLAFSDEQKAFINSNYSNQNVADRIISGDCLVFPPNLYIWATMNTSDQSLFPIDSAFKRRWDWKYMKIKDEKKNWKIDIKQGEENVDWWNFVQKINAIIASMTSSADKQLGYFFCKADKKAKDEDSEPTIISAETFVSKVIFYLWNDVFKDTGFEDESLFTYEKAGKKTELTFPDFYDEDGENVDAERVADFINRVMTWQKQEENL